MQLILEAVPNRDFPRGSWEATVNIPAHVSDVKDVEAARQACFDFIRKHELGGGNWSAASGRVHDRAGNFVERFSYNLR